MGGWQYRCQECKYMAVKLNSKRTKEYNYCTYWEKNMVGKFPPLHLVSQCFKKKNKEESEC